jgi:hypothetical protein
MKNIIKFSMVLLLMVNVFYICVLTANADGLLPDTEGDQPAATAAATCKSSNCGNYTLNEMVSVAVKVANLILSVVGSLSLLAFVAGGLMWMLSAGNPEWVTRGKQTIIGAVIGLAIVFTSYTIIFFVYKSLGITGSDWFTSGWFK